MASQRQLYELETRFAFLRQQADGLLAKRNTMVARERLLSAWCSGLDLLKQVGAADLGSEHNEGWKRCQELEQLLQHMLAEVHGNGVDSNSMELLPCTSLVEERTIAPASDPMAYFRKLLLQPIMPAAATMTTEELAQLLREVTMEATMQQQLLQMTPHAEREPVVQKLQQIWDRYLHAVLSLYLLDRAHVSQGLVGYNLELMQPDTEGALQHEQVVATRINQLQLTPQQQEAISVGGELHKERIKLIHLTRQRVQTMQVGGGSTPQQSTDTGFQRATSTTSSNSNCGSSTKMGDLTAAWQHNGSSNGMGGSASSNASGSGGSGNGRGLLDTLHDRQKDMQAAWEKVEQLEMLLREENQLRILSWGWFTGCLSWPQFTTVSTICWPYARSPVAVVQAVHAQWRNQQQQQHSGNNKVQQVTG